MSFQGSPLDIINLYLPPWSSCPQNYSPNFQLLFDLHNDSIVVGDFNAHSPSWFSQTLDANAALRGEAIDEALNGSSLCLLNEESPTRVPANSQPSSPDLSLCSAHLSLSLSWHTLPTLNSDHLPIFISNPNQNLNPSRPFKTFLNFQKANWDSFTNETENLFSNLPFPSSASINEHTFRQILLTASKHSVPAGFRKNHIPNFPPNVSPLIQERDTLRQTDPTNPRIVLLNNQISQLFSQHSKKKWQDTLSSSDPKTNPSKFWSLLKTLSGKRNNPPPNQPISFGPKTFTSSKDISNSFIKQFTSISRHQTNPSCRKIFRNLCKKHPLDRSFIPFTPALVQKAIKDSSNSSAIGPDNLNILHLKNLGPNGISYLTSLFNLSIQSSDIPAIWKTSKIIPLLKPGKPPDSSTSYRPISLLCPAAKVLERLLLPYLNNSLPTHPSQHGFKPLHSTTSALLTLSNSIAEGFNQKQPPSRTLAAAIDLSKAFDSVPIHLLISKISSTNLHPNIIRWFSTYLRGRMAYCSYNYYSSSHRIVRTGVPQGSVTSPCLFNFYVSDSPQHQNTTSFSFADDLESFSSSPSIPQSESHLNQHLSSISDWASLNGLSIAPNKSSVTLFTPDKRHESNLVPNVQINSTPIPLNKSPTFLGVTFDTHFTFSPHISSISSKVSSRIRILKALAGTSWGHQKETLLLTFKTLIRPIITYACPVWFPNVSPSNVLSLQRLQNRALRTCTGSLLKSSQSHLHNESKILPVKEHLSLLCSQYLASSRRPFHPAHSLTHPSLRPRNMKHTLSSKFYPTVAPFLVNDILPPANYKPVLSSLHTNAVTQTIRSFDPNVLLNSSPPEIDPSESTLPRPYRCTLSQLRSSHCSRLNSYLHSIGASPSSTCPSCNLAPDTTQHLFSCPNNPTNLSLIDLWTNPLDVAHFLSTHPSFTNLPPLPPPPPEPPP